MTSRSRARVGRLAGLALLAFVALFLAHDAIYVAEYGAGRSYAAAMAATGHDGYYVPASLIVGVAALLAAVATLLRLGHLTIVAQSAAGRASRRRFIDVGPTYFDELRALWSRLGPAVVLLFVLQENTEALLAGRAIPGADVLFGPGAGLVLPILGIATFLLAVVGAAIRWRTRILLGKVHAPRRYARPQNRRPDPTWTTVIARIAHDWILDRCDAGRAPPITA